MINNRIINRKKSNEAFGFCRYIGFVLGTVLLSAWSPKVAYSVNSPKQELRQEVFKEITGIVKTQDGDPISGVVVLKVGTNQGTDTDIDGRYHLNANEGDKIQFVYDGFKTTTVTVAQSNILNITMVEDKDVLSDILIDEYRTVSIEKIPPHGTLAFNDKTIEGEPRVKSTSLVNSFQQEVFKEITGIVKTQDGDPISGVVVLKVGTNQGTDTDIDGRYHLNANEGDKIQFVFEGFKTTTVTVFQNNILNITLVEDKDVLSDILINEYRTISREEKIKYGITTREIENGYPSRWYREMLVLNAKRSNLNIATGANIKIVRTGSLLKGNELNKNKIIDIAFPLIFNVDMRPPEVYRNPEVILKDVVALTRNGNYTYIVDGVRVSEETFRSLNQNDVESVDIYKHTDAYNARFGNKENQSRIVLKSK